MAIYFKKKSDDASSLTNDMPMIDMAFLPAEPLAPTILNLQSGFSSQWFEK